MPQVTPADPLPSSVLSCLPLLWRRVLFPGAADTRAAVSGRALLLLLILPAVLLYLVEALRGERLRWGWWLLAAAACGLGVLTKGPVGLVLLAPPAWAYRRLSGRPWRVGRPAVAAFLAVVLAVAAPWFVAVCVR